MSNALNRFLELFIVLSDRSNDQRHKISRKKKTVIRNSLTVTQLQPCHAIDFAQSPRKETINQSQNLFK